MHAIPVALAFSISLAAAESGASCAILVERHGSAIRITAVATGSLRAGGTYAFVVEKQAASATSRSVQAGDFEAPSDTYARLAQVVIGLEPGTMYAATLQLRGGGGEIVCSERLDDITLAP